MRRPNHASRFEGIAKTKLQASRASDTETLQSQVNKAAEKRLSLSGLEVLHGRQIKCGHETSLLFWTATACRMPSLANKAPSCIDFAILNSRIRSLSFTLTISAMGSPCQSMPSKRLSRGEDHDLRLRPRRLWRAGGWRAAR